MFLFYPLKLYLRYGKTREYCLLVTQEALEQTTFRCDTGGGGDDVNDD